MSTKNVAITVRFPALVLEKIDAARGSEPTANFIRRAVVGSMNDSQKNDAVIAAVTEARAAILKSIHSLVAE